MENYLPISIIIPVYNTESYLRQCLDSAVCQTYEHLDIIIIDDGSTDGSSKICDEYASNPRIRVYHTPNHGISAARNFGLDHLDAQCKYVAFLDSDDWMESDCIQRMYNAVIRNDTDLAVCQFLNDYENQSIGASQIKEEKIVENKQILNELLVSNSIHNVVWNKLYSSDLFNNIRFPVGRTYEDVATTYKVLENVERVTILPDNLIHYRIRNGSLSHNTSLTKLNDSWIAYYERYCYLYDKLSDPISKAKLIISCLSPINNIGDVVPTYAWLDSIVDSMLQQNPDSRPFPTSTVATRILAAKNDWQQSQELLRLAEEQTQQEGPYQMDIPTIRDALYEDGYVKVFLDGIEYKWFDKWFGVIQQGSYNHTVLMGYDTQRLKRFARDCIAMPVHSTREYDLKSMGNAL